MLVLILARKYILAQMFLYNSAMHTDRVPTRLTAIHIRSTSMWRRRADLPNVVLQLVVPHSFWYQQKKPTFIFSFDNCLRRSRLRTGSNVFQTHRAVLVAAANGSKIVRNPSLLLQTRLEIEQCFYIYARGDTIVIVNRYRSLSANSWNFLQTPLMVSLATPSLRGSSNLFQLPYNCSREALEE